MATTLASEVLNDELAVSVARALAAANRRARELGVNALQSLVTVTQQVVGGEQVWRVNYGPRDYVARRGGDVVVDVAASDMTVRSVLQGQ